jgi:hypothetical protein
MSTSAPPPGATTPPPPLAPPDEQFWDRYSPHHEFPLSSVGSIAMHVGGLVLFLLALWLLSRMAISDKTAVPMRVMTVAGEGDDGESTGSGGGEQKRPEDVDPVRQVLPKRDVPQADLDHVVEDIKPYLPKVPSNQEGLRPEDLPTPKKIAGLDEEMKKALLDGMNGNKGKGPGAGSSGAAVEGPGAGTKGDATSSSNRAVRWELNFKTENGNDYVNQLAAMKATLVIPQPANWKANKAYTNLTAHPPAGEDFNIDKLPGLYFVDDDPGSAGRLTRSMGLDFSPPHFIAFFPKDIEEELAAKERAFRGRKESEIFSTTFKILIRDGKPTITVIDQVPVKK